MLETTIEEEKSWDRPEMSCKQEKKVEEEEIIIYT